MTNLREVYFQKLDDLHLKVADNHFVFLLFEENLNELLANKIIHFMSVLNHLIHHSHSLPSKFKFVLITQDSHSSLTNHFFQSPHFDHFKDNLLIIHHPDALFIDAIFARTDVLLDWHNTSIDNFYISKAIQRSLPVFCSDTTLQAKLWAMPTPDFGNSFEMQIAFWLQILQDANLLRSIKHVQYQTLINHTNQSKPLDSALHWKIEGPYDSSYSLALVNRELAFALDNAGEKVSLRCFNGLHDVAPNALYLKAYPQIKNLMNAANNDGALISLRNTYPPYLADMEGKFKILSSYGWEETSYPLEFVEHINFKADAVFVVSQFVKKSMQESGVRVPIFVVGNGVDHLLHIQAEKKHETTHWKKFRFLHISSCFPRKGVDLLLQAYGDEFTINDDVSLVIKTFANPHNDLLKQIEVLRSNNVNFPHVDIIWEEYSDAQIKALYIDCDAVVIPSRGEGFGLPVAEAILMEKPVIVTNWSGQTDFINEDNTWCVDFDFEDAQSHFSGMHSAWASPKIEQIRLHMRNIFQSDRSTILPKVLLAKNALLANFTWKDVANRNLAAVNSLCKLSSPKHSSKIAWVSTWNTRCGIASYSEFLTQKIPFSDLTILANHSVERIKPDADNVIRCWGDDYLDPVDELKSQIEQSRADILVIQYNFGFFPLHSLAEIVLFNKMKGRQVHVFFHATGDLSINNKPVTLQSIAKTLEKADKIYVHAIRDLNHLKSIGLVDNVVYFPQGVLEASNISSNIKPSFPLTNLGSQDKIIAAYGFLMPHKGVSNLIRAFKNWLDKGNCGRLILVNAIYPSTQSKLEFNHCHSIIHSLGISHLVSFHTDYLADSESLKLLQFSDLIVYAYQNTNESSSAAVRLGLASGKPVAVTPLHIFKDVADVTYELPGFSDEDLTIGLERFFNNEEQINHLLQRNLAKWKKERAWSSLSNRLMNIFDSIRVDASINH